MATLCLHCPPPGWHSDIPKDLWPMVLPVGKETQGGHPAPSVLQALPRSLTWVPLHEVRWASFSQGAQLTILPELDPQPIGHTGVQFILGLHLGKGGNSWPHATAEQSFQTYPSGKPGHRCPAAEHILRATRAGKQTCSPAQLLTIYLLAPHNQGA